MDDKAARPRVLTVVGIVSLVLSLAGRLYPTRPAKMMGRMTLSDGAAQIVAPAATGALATTHGGYQIGLKLAAAAMAIGVAFLAMARFAEAKDREPWLRRDVVGEGA